MDDPARTLSVELDVDAEEFRAEVAEAKRELQSLREHVDAANDAIERLQSRDKIELSIAPKFDTED